MDKNPSLLEVCQQVASLPAYMRADAVKNVIAEWRSKSPLVEEVASGRTTFEKAIAALVEENLKLSHKSMLKGAISSPEFKATANDATVKFSDILPLGEYIGNGRAVRYVDIGSSIRWSWMATGLLVTMMLSSLIISGVISYLSGGLTAIWKGLALGMIVPISIGGMVVLIIFTSEIPDRRYMAKRILERAQFLDKMIAPA